MIEVQTNPELGIRFVALSHPGTMEGLDYRTENAYRIDASKGIGLIIDGGYRTTGMRPQVNDVADIFLEKASEAYFDSSEEDLYQMIRSIIAAREELDRKYKVADNNNFSGTALKVTKKYDSRFCFIGHSGITRASVYTPGHIAEVVTPHDIHGYNYSKIEKKLAAFRVLDDIVSKPELEKLSLKLRHLFAMREEPATDLINGYSNYRSDLRVIGEGRNIILTSPGIHLNLTSNEIATALVSDAELTVQNLVNMGLERSKDETHLRRFQAPLTALVVEAF